MTLIRHLNIISGFLLQKAIIFFSKGLYHVNLLDLNLDGFSRGWSFRRLVMGNKMKPPYYFKKSSFYSVYEVK